MRFVLLIVALMLGYSTVQAESSDDLTAALIEHQRAISLSDGTLTGEGAQWLRSEAEQAEFLLIGEEHGVADIIEFTQGLYRDIQPLGYNWYVTEVGPVSSTRLSTLASHARLAKPFEDFYQRFPYAIPFSVYTEEVELLRTVLRSSPVRPQPILGIDQEFVWSVPLHMIRLEAMTTNQQHKAFLRNTRRLEQKAYSKIVSAGDPGAAPTLLTGERDQATIERLQVMFPEPGTEEHRIVSSLADSREIYRAFYEQRYYDNNNIRAELMRKYFSQWYHQINSEYEKPRFLFKLGSNHVVRGNTVLNIQDIGNAVAELALMHGGKSFHLLVLPLSGQRNGWLPFLPDETISVPIDVTQGAYKNYAGLMDALPEAEGWQIYDLRPLRQRIRHFAGDDAMLEKMITGYDAVLTIDNARPATLVPQGKLTGYHDEDEDLEF